MNLRKNQTQHNLEVGRQSFGMQSQISIVISNMTIDFKRTTYTGGLSLVVCRDRYDHTMTKLQQQIKNNNGI